MRREGSGECSTKEWKDPEGYGCGRIYEARRRRREVVHKKFLGEMGALVKGVKGSLAAIRQKRPTPRLGRSTNTWKRPPSEREVVEANEQSKTPLQRNKCATHACFIIPCFKNCGQHTAVHSWSCGNSGRTSNDQDCVLKWNFMAQAKTNMYKAVLAFLGSSLRCLAIPNVFLAFSRVWMHCWTFLDVVVILSVPRYFFCNRCNVDFFLLSVSQESREGRREVHWRYRGRGTIGTQGGHLGTRHTRREVAQSRGASDHWRRGHTRAN